MNVLVECTSIFCADKNFCRCIHQCVHDQKWKLLTLFIFAGTTNNLLQVEVLESGSNVMIKCRLLAAVTKWVHCEARYGTDSSHHVLPYRDTSNNAGLEGVVLTIHISHDLQSHTTYYYNVSLVAVDGIISARVLHSISIGKEISTCVDSFKKKINEKKHNKINNYYL